MSRMLRVFVNGRALDVPDGATALDAVRALDAAAASRVQAGEETVTDSRGLPAALDEPLQAGAIFRIIPRRARRAGGADDDDQL